VEDINTDSVAEEIYADFFSQQLITTSDFPGARALLRLDLDFRPVHSESVYRCPDCRRPVAIVRLNHRELRVIDAVRDEQRSLFWTRWNADLLSKHECGGNCQ
jgi:hypothetical protein